MLAGIGLIAAALAIAGRSWSYEHARLVTGTESDGFPRCLACHGSQSPAEFDRGRAHAAPWDLAPSPDARLLFAACARLKRVAVIDVALAAVTRWIEVPGEPGGVAVSPDGGTLAVSLADRDEVALADIETGAVQAQVAAGFEPHGLAFAADGASLFVANAGSGDVSVIDVATRRERLRVPAGREPHRVTRSPDGRVVAVMSRAATLCLPESAPSSEMTLIDGATGAVRRRVALPSVHLAEGVSFSADGARVLVPALRVRNLVPIAQVARGWVTSGTLVSVDVATGEIALLPLGTVNRPFADPTGVAVSPDGSRVFVASSGNDVVAAIDGQAARAAESACDPDGPESFAAATAYVLSRATVGAVPADVEMVRRGGRDVVAVSERLADSVALLDAGDLSLVARIPLGPQVDDDAVHRGERTFHDARFAFQGAFSCRSCHPEGHTDGLAYDFDVDGVGRDFLLNRSLQGIRGTAPFKWAGSNATLERQCGPRFAMVLTRADPIPDDRLGDLVAYLESLPPSRPAPVRRDTVDVGRSTAVDRGRAIFLRETTKKGEPIPPEARCATCHAGPLYTNRLKADVGTRTAADRGAIFDVPHLTGVGRKAPYLHDGRARSLEEIWTLPGVEDRHGQVTDMNKSDLNDLVEFLRSL